MNKETFIDMCFDILKTEFYENEKELNFYELFEIIYKKERILNAMEKCKTFKFRQLNQDIGHEILGKHIFANCKINNAWEFVFFYDLLNEHVLHTTLEIDFRKKFNNMRQLCMQKYLLNVYEAGITIIKWLKEKNYEKLNAHWVD